MESLLSASLSQEQEFSRELQRRVRELQMIDKGRRIHEEVLEAEARACREREELLIISNENYVFKLTFTLYSLILSQIWRSYASQNPKALVTYSTPITVQFSTSINTMAQWINNALTQYTNNTPYVECCEKEDFSELMDYSNMTENESSIMESNQNHHHQNQHSDCANFNCDSFHQEDLPDLSGTNVCYVNVCDMYTQTDDYEGCRSVSVQVESSDDGYHAPSVEDWRAKNGFKENDSDLSEREQYYLEQIESLQNEKRCLRKDYEAETTDSFHQVQELRKKLNSLEDALKEVEEDRCRLMFKLEETQTEALEAERNLQRRRKEMKEDLRTSIDVLNREQDVLQRQYEERLSELRIRNGSYEDRISLLMHQLSTLRQELTPFLVLRESEGYKTEDSDEAESVDSVGDLAKSVRVLIRAHNAFKQKVEELENKDNAYRETINEADRLMSSHMTIYTRRIEELEASQDQKELRITQLESSEERLRDALRKASASSDDGDRISELLDKLLATENSTLGLKEQLWLLERNEKELRIKMVESEKVQQGLRRELRDQEDLVQRLMNLTTENNALTSQLQEAHECSRRASEMQQNENYLKGRVEELESTEGALRDALVEAQQIIKHRDKKYREQCQNLQEDIIQLKAQMETAIGDGERAKEVEASLRDQLATYREKSLSFDKEISDTQLNETQYRAEVAKLRSQLKLGNMQLTELDCLNGELRDKVTMAEEAMKQVVSQLEERSRRHESEVLSLNLELSHKDSKLEDIESHMNSLSQANAASELDCLSNLPLNRLKNALDNVYEITKECSSCQFSKSNLNTLQDSVKSLNEAINGRISQSDSDTEESESIPSKLCSTASETDDSQRESHTLDDSSQRTATPNLEEHLKVAVKVPTPSVPPRPRRDAKKRRKTRVRNTEGSLMDELEEGVFGTSPASFNVLEELEERIKDLEDEVTRKEDELKLADAESAELHSRLMKENGERGRKASEVTELTLSLSGLRDQLVQTVQEYEHSKNIMESEHKALVESLNLKMEALASALLALGEKTCVKDAIIQTLIGQIKDILRSGNLGVLVTQIRLLGNSGKILRENYSDFDIQSVCDLMSRPQEIPQVPTENQQDEPEMTTSRSQSLPSLSTSAATNRTPLRRDSISKSTETSPIPILGENHETPLTSTPKTLPPLSNQKRSRIPLMRPSSVPPIKIDLRKGKMRNSRERQTPSALSPMKEHQNPRDPMATPTGRKIYQQNNSKVEPKGLKPLERVTPHKQRPTAKVTPTTFVQRKAASTASFSRRSAGRPVSPSKKQFPACSSTPSTPSAPRFSPWANKEPEKLKSSSKYISDARKIKRMVMGVSPLDASVDCASAPEWAQSTPNLSSHAQAPTCVPRPSDLRITRRVGVDGVVIAWSSLDHDCIQGFQVLVGGQMVQVVRSPHRTKALVTGLPFPSPFTISLVAVSNDGRVSLPTLVTHDQNNVYKSRLDSGTSLASSNRSKAIHLPVHTALRAANHCNVSPRRAVPTCL